VHSVLRPSIAHLRLRCRGVSDTPIYDQLWGERLNADVPAADPQQVGYQGQHRRPAAASRAPAAHGHLAASGSDPVASQSSSAAVEQAVQAALAAARRARLTAETRAVRRPANQARHRGAHAASGPATPADGRSAPAREAAPFSWFERPA
jgi:hypothetical protein